MSGSGGRRSFEAGGKSEQDRARWWLTATRGDPRASATENTQPMAPLLLCMAKQEILISNIEILNKSEIRMFEFSKRVVLVI